MLQQQSSSVDLPDGSCYFIGAQHPIYSGDVCSVLGKFMLQDPHVFYVVYGRMERPWIYPNLIIILLWSFCILAIWTNSAEGSASIKVEDKKGRSSVLTGVVPVAAIFFLGHFLNMTFQ